MLLLPSRLALTSFLPFLRLLFFPTTLSTTTIFLFSLLLPLLLLLHRPTTIPTTSKRNVPASTPSATTGTNSFILLVTPSSSLHPRCYHTKRFRDPTPPPSPPPPLTTTSSSPRVQANTPTTPPL